MNTEGPLSQTNLPQFEQLFTQAELNTAFKASANKDTDQLGDAFAGLNCTQQPKSKVIIGKEQLSVKWKICSSAVLVSAQEQQRHRTSPETVPMDQD